MLITPVDGRSVFCRSGGDGGSEMVWIGWGTTDAQSKTLLGEYFRYEVSYDPHDKTLCENYATLTHVVSTSWDILFSAACTTLRLIVLLVDLWVCEKSC